MSPQHILHEVGNVLAYQRFTNIPYDARPYAVQPQNDWIRQHVDSDVGMALGECVYGGVYMGNGVVIP
jgi:hypothetical protein